MRTLLVAAAVLLVVVGASAFTHSYGGSFHLTIAFVPQPTGETWALTIQDSRGYYWTPNNPNGSPGFTQFLTRFWYSGASMEFSLAPGDYVVQAYSAHNTGTALEVYPAGDAVFVRLDGNHMLTFFGNGTGVLLP